MESDEVLKVNPPAGPSEPNYQRKVEELQAFPPGGPTRGVIMLAPTKVGDVYGRLTIQSLHKKELCRENRLFAICLCTCGKSKDILVSYLRYGKITSCGCRMGGLKHGLSYTPEYQVWGSMWSRCKNPKDPGYQHYQNRTPPEAWKKFENFIADMGPRPSSEYSLERVDNNKGYSPSNCIWLPKNEQCKNRSTTRWITNGVLTVCLTDACRLAKVKPDKTMELLNRFNWPVEKLLGPEWREVPTRFPVETPAE